MKNKTIYRTLQLAITLTLFMGHYGSAQQYQIPLDQLFESEYSKNITGASVLISKKGKIIYSNQFGLANAELNVPITEETKFSIGSVTKQFTAAAILLLQEQGKVNVSDKLGKHLPAFATANYASVTLQHLLTHTSGMPSDNSEKDISKNLRNNLTSMDIASFIKDEPLLFAPGEAHDYSNNGYILLGLIIEKASGVTFGEFLERNIFKPLKMNNTIVTDYQEIIKNRASGYTSDENDQLINATYHSSSYSAGGIVSTAMDLNKWGNALFSNQVLSTKSLALMLNNYTLQNGKKLNLGFGWEINEVSGHKSYEHSGFEPGYKVNTIYVPEKQLYVVVMQNNEMGSPTPMAIKAAAICLNKAYPMVSKDLNAKKQENIIGTYQLEGGDKRYIVLKNQNLYYKKPGGKGRKLYINSEDQLFFENEYIQLHCDMDSSGKITGATYKNRIYAARLVKISNDVPQENVAIAIPVSVMENYVGSYKSPQFIMHISMENSNLFAQPEGSDKLKLLPKGQSKFFIKEIGAELEFISDDNGEANQINIMLEGNVMVGVRIKS